MIRGNPSECRARLCDNIECVMWVLDALNGLDEPGDRMPQVHAYLLLEKARDLLKSEGRVGAVQRVAEQRGCSYGEAVLAVDCSIPELLEKNRRMLDLVTELRFAGICNYHAPSPLPELAKEAEKIIADVERSAND